MVSLVEFNSSNDRVTCFVGFLPTLLSVSDVKGTGDSCASFSGQNKSVRNPLDSGGVTHREDGTEVLIPNTPWLGNIQYIPGNREPYPGGVRD